jgi:hypothetical protein
MKFQGICRYTLSKSVAPVCPFNVEVQHERRYGKPKVSYNKYLIFEIYGKSFRMEKNYKTNLHLVNDTNDIWKIYDFKIEVVPFIINFSTDLTTVVIQQVVGIPMGTNCTPLLADLFVCSYESEYLQNLVKDKKIHEARAFNFTYRYIDDV